MGRVTRSNRWFAGIVAGVMALGSLPGVASAVELEILGDMTSPHGGFGTYQNLLKYSEQMDQSAWTPANTVTPVADQTPVAPDGSQTADKLTFGGAGTVDALTQDAGVVSTTDTYTFSVWLRSVSGGTTIELKIEDANENNTTVVTGLEATRWERYTVSQTFASAGGNIKVTLLENAAADAPVIEAWGAQLEKSSKANVYVRTSGETVSTTAQGLSVGKNLHAGGNVEAVGTLATGANGTDGQVNIYSEQGATDYNVTLQPHAAMTQDVTYTLPVDDGTTGQVLKTDGTGGLAWVNAANAAGGLTINRALISDGTGNLAVSAVTNTELGYVSGVTSGLQNQLDAKAPLASPTFTGTVNGITKAMVGLGNVDNTSDLGKPVSSDTQTALNLKAPLASPTFSGNITLPGTGYWKSDGNLGIGTATPNEKLHVVAGGAAVANQPGAVATFQDSAAVSSNAYLSLVSGSTAITGVLFGNTADRDIGLIDYDASTNTMSFRTNNAAQMWVSSVGNVGIGSANPATKLDVAGTITSTGLSAGSAGIGIASPVEMLQVAGNARLGAAPAAATTLTAAVTDGTDTTLTVASTTGYPARGALLVQSEAMTYTGTTATTFTGLTRGLWGTPVGGHANGSTVIPYLLSVATSAPAPKLIVTGDGRLGLGVAQPGRQMELYQTDSSNAILRLSSKDSAAGSPYQAAMEFYASTTGDVSSVYPTGRLYGLYDDAGYADSRLTLQSVNGNGDFVDTLSLKNTFVGIGTTAPAEVLDVNGRLRLTPTTAPVTTTNKLYNVGGALYWNNTNLLSDSTPAFTAITSGTNTQAAMVVGAGASLTYNGGTPASGVINANQFKNNATIQAADLQSTVLLEGDVGTGLDVSSGTVFFAPAEVGTATWLDNADRTWTFDVAAAGTNPQMSFSSGTIGVAADTAVTGTLSASGQLTANGGITADGGVFSVTDATGALHTAGDFDVNTNKFTVAAASGNTAVAGTLGVTGAASLSSTLGVTGASTLTGLVTANGGITADGGVFTVADTTGAVQTAGTLTASQGAYLATVSGNVGIGMSNPDYKLDVAGSARVAGDLKVRSADKVVMDSSDAGGTASDTYMVHDNANDRIRLYVDGIEVARFKK